MSAASDGNANNTNATPVANRVLVVAVPAVRIVVTVAAAAAVPDKRITSSRFPLPAENRNPASQYPAVQALAARCRVAPDPDRINPAGR